MSTLPTWDDQMEALKGVADHLLATWRPEGPTEAEIQDMNKLALSILACGYLCNVYTDPRRPVFMPLWNFACNQGGPNPDHVYFATDDLDACYRRVTAQPNSSILRHIETQPWGERSFYCTDPFGNKLCFVDNETLFTAGLI